MQTTSIDYEKYPTIILEKEILKALIYSDIFDFPLKMDEIIKYSRVDKKHKIQIATALTRLVASKKIATNHEFYFLPSRKETVSIRKQRKNYSQLLLKRSEWVIYLLSCLPFIKMIAITGSLAVNNASSENDDIDLFIMTKKNRLWIARILIVLVMLLVKRTHALYLCPNYLIADDELNLLISSRNIYTARELVNMVPVYNTKVYRKYIRINNWILKFFPNFNPQTARIITEQKQGSKTRLFNSFKRVGELFLGFPIFNVLDSFEMRRTSIKLQKLSSSKAENYFSKNCCKSHLEGHGKRIKNVLVSKLISNEFLNE